MAGGVAWGLMCGTFDPPHIGHLILAQTAAHQLGLERVLFLPVGEPTHKTTQTAVCHRLAMVRLAIADNSLFALDATDAERPPPHYSATLLPLLRQIYLNQSLCFLMGSDSLNDLPDWHAPRKLIAQCRLAVLRRPGFGVDEGRLDEAVPGWRERTTWLKGPSMYVSSSFVRGAVQGEGLRYVLPTAVREYIHRNQLYG